MASQARGLDAPPAPSRGESGLVCTAPGCDRPRARYKRLCPACRMREWRKSHRIEARAREAARVFTDEQTLLRRARAYVSTMIRRGKMARGACSICGDSAKVSPTWRDPLRPLDVRWLCATHLGHAQTVATETRATKARVRAWLDSIERALAAIPREEHAALRVAYVTLLSGRRENGWARGMALQAVANYLGGRTIIIDGSFRLGSRVATLEPRERLAAALREIDAA